MMLRRYSLLAAAAALAGPGDPALVLAEQSTGGRDITSYFLFHSRPVGGTLKNLTPLVWFTFTLHVGKRAKGPGRQPLICGAVRVGGVIRADNTSPAPSAGVFTSFLLRLVTSSQFACSLCLILITESESLLR